MRAGLFVSVLGHVALIGFGVVSLRSTDVLDASQVEAIPVAFIQIDEITQLTPGTAVAEPEPEPEVAAIEQPVEEPPEPEPPPPPEPEPEPEPEPVPEPEPAEPLPPEPEPLPETPTEPEPEPEQSLEPVNEPEPAAESVPDFDPDAPEPEPEPEPDNLQTEEQPEDDVPAEEPPKLETATLSPRLRPDRPAPTEQDQADQIASLLGDGGEEGVATTGIEEATSEALTVSQVDALKERFRRCWTPPFGYSDPAEVRVKVSFQLNRDGTVAGQPEILEAPNGPFTLQAQDTVIRAVFECAPYNLPVDKYDSWKEVRITFDPRDM